MTGPYTSTGGVALASSRAAPARAKQSVERDAQRERGRNLRRAGLVSAVLLAALSTGFFAGVNSGTVTSLFQRSSMEALEASKARRAELRSGTILFASPDGENCRPVHFDNQTGEMSPGAGTVPCHSRDPNRRAQVDDGGRFNWRNGK